MRLPDWIDLVTADSTPELGPEDVQDRDGVMKWLASLGLDGDVVMKVQRWAGHLVVERAMVDEAGLMVVDGDRVRSEWVSLGDHRIPLDLFRVPLTVRLRVDTEKLTAELERMERLVARFGRRTAVSS